MTRIIAIALETVGICTILLAVGIEVHYEADIGFVMATAGAGMVAFGSLIYAKLMR